MKLSFDYVEKFWKIHQDTGRRALFAENMPGWISRRTALELKFEKRKGKAQKKKPERQEWYEGTIIGYSVVGDEGTHDVQYWDDNKVYSEILVPSEKGPIVKHHLLL